MYVFPIGFLISADGTDIFHPLARADRKQWIEIAVQWPDAICSHPFLYPSDLCPHAELLCQLSWRG